MLRKGFDHAVLVEVVPQQQAESLGGHFEACLCEEGSSPGEGILISGARILQAEQLGGGVFLFGGMSVRNVVFVRRLRRLI